MNARAEIVDLRELDHNLTNVNILLEVAARIAREALESPGRRWQEPLAEIEQIVAAASDLLMKSADALP
jgi:hypothetical protein